MHGTGLSLWVASEFIEAAIRSGKAERAVGPLARLTAIAEANGTDWSLGLRAARAAMLAEGAAAERLYREAIERLGRTRIRVAEARAHLLYGEWLRRENRRVDARRLGVARPGATLWNRVPESGEGSVEPTLPKP